jgi:hypothetical protein
MDDLLNEHSKGGILIPTELEIIMLDEALEFITLQFESRNKRSNHVLNKLLTKFKRLEANTHENLDQQILEIVKAKLNDDT